VQPFVLQYGRWFWVAADARRRRRRMLLARPANDVVAVLVIMVRVLWCFLARRMASWAIGRSR
jgi:hypothetical protein